jgi:hypothetical protein
LNFTKKKGVGSEMASINLKIKSDFDQASKDLKKFGTLTESQRKQVEKYQKSFKGESIDKFIDKNRRLGAGMRANKTDTQAIIAQQKALERQSISLIRNGLDPQDKSIQKLNEEYNRLQKEYDETTQKTKAMESASKNATIALKAIGIAAIAVGVAMVKSTIDISKMGDDLAKTSRKVGVSVEALQELSFAAERTGLPANNLSGLFQKLNRNIGDLQVGTGTLTTFLNKSDVALKEQLLSTTDSEEAFNLLIDAIAKAPTQFDKAALSQAAFGRAGQDLILFANEGAEGIQKLRDEASRYGLISEDVARQSEDFVDAQRNIAQAFIGVRSELAGKLLPAMTDSVNKVADFIAEGDNLEEVLKTIAVVTSSVAAGLITFTVATKGAMVISTLTKAVKALNLAMAANPAVFAAAAIATLTVATLGLIEAQTGMISKFKESKRIQDAFKDGTIETADKLSVVKRQIAENSVEIDKLEDMYSRATNDKFRKKWQEQLEVLYEQNQVARRIESAIRLEIKAKQDLIDKEKEEARLLAEKIIKEKESSDAILKSYVDQNEAVQSILGTKKDEIEIIQEQIDFISTLALREGELKDDQLAAIRILQDKQDAVAQERTDAINQNVQDFKKAEADKLKVLQDNLVIEKEAKKAANDAEVQQVLDFTDMALSQAQKLADGQLEISVGAYGEFVGMIGESTGMVELEIAAVALNAIGVMIDIFSGSGDEMGEALGESVKVAMDDVIAAVKNIGNQKWWEGLWEGFVKGMSGLNDEIESEEQQRIKRIAKMKIDSDEKYLTEKLNLQEQFDNEEFNRRKALLDEEYKDEIQGLKDLENDKIKLYVNGLTAKEQANLKASGVIAETETERINREIAEAQTAGDLELVQTLRNEEKIVNIKESSLAQQAEAKEAYEANVRAFEREKAIYSRDLAISRTKIEQLRAISEVPVYDVAGNLNPLHAEVRSLYTGLLSQLESTPIPSAQTGTPLGGFTVPTNNNNSGADNVGLNVSQGEQVTVKPRGEGGNSQNITIQIGKETILDIINDGIEDGDIRITTDNIQGGVSVA